MTKDPTAAQAGKHLDGVEKATMVTFLANGKHLFLDATQTKTLMELLEIRQKAGAFYGRFKNHTRSATR